MKLLLKTMLLLLASMSAFADVGKVVTISINS